MVVFKVIIYFLELVNLSTLKPFSNASSYLQKCSIIGGIILIFPDFSSKFDFSLTLKNFILP